MGFTEVTVVWEGAIETQECFLTSKGAEQLVEDLKAEAAGTEDLVEMYVLYHDHDLELECECSQYVTDHRPYWTNEA